VVNYGGRNCKFFSMNVPLKMERKVLI